MRFVPVTGYTAQVWRLEGDVDADSAPELKRLAHDGTSAHVQLDLADLRSINSPGAVGWATGMAYLLERCTVDLVNCPVMFVDYSNFFPGMLQPQGAERKARVLSFFVPYYCQGCNRELTQLVTVADLDVAGGKPELPTMGCKGCGEDLPPEVNPEDYLTFLFR